MARRRAKFSKIKKRKDSSAGIDIGRAHPNYPMLQNHREEAPEGLLQKAKSSDLHFTPNSHKRKRNIIRMSTLQEDDELSDIDFATLQPKTKAIKTETIKQEWTVSTNASQARVRGLFDLVQQLSFRSQRVEKRQMEHQLTLFSLRQSLEKRLPRMPFPSSTKDWHFDYESILRSNQSLEEQSNSAVHSIALLKAKINQEAQFLNESRIGLDGLEKSSKSEETLRIRSNENLIPRNTYENNQSLIEITIAEASEVLNRGSLPMDSTEHPASILFHQVYDHIESFEANYSQTKVLKEQLDIASAKLASLLSRSLVNTST